MRSRQPFPVNFSRILTALGDAVVSITDPKLDPTFRQGRYRISAGVSGASLLSHGTDRTQSPVTSVAGTFMEFIDPGRHSANTTETAKERDGKGLRITSTPYLTVPPPGIVARAQRQASQTEGITDWEI